MQAPQGATDHSWLARFAVAHKLRRPAGRCQRINARHLAPHLAEIVGLHVAIPEAAGWSGVGPLEFGPPVRRVKTCNRAALPWKVARLQVLIAKAQPRRYVTFVPSAGVGGGQRWSAAGSLQATVCPAPAGGGLRRSCGTVVFRSAQYWRRARLALSSGVGASPRKPAAAWGLAAALCPAGGPGMHLREAARR